VAAWTGVQAIVAANTASVAAAFIPVSRSEVALSPQQELGQRREAV